MIFRFHNGRVALPGGAVGHIFTHGRDLHIQTQNGRSDLANRL